MPNPEVALACGSQSTTNTLRPANAVNEAGVMGGWVFLSRISFAESLYVDVEQRDVARRNTGYPRGLSDRFGFDLIEFFLSFFAQAFDVFEVNRRRDPYLFDLLKTFGFPNLSLDVAFVFNLNFNLLFDRFRIGCYFLGVLAL